MSREPAAKNMSIGKLINIYKNDMLHPNRSWSGLCNEKMAGV